jgi:hypothetical protein
MVERSDDVQGRLLFGVSGSATIDQSGVLVADSAGACVVTVSTDDGAVSATANVVIVEAPEQPKIGIPAAVTRGEAFVASILSPLVGYSYNWTALNADFATAPVGNAVTLVPLNEGPLFVSVQARNAAGDSAIPIGGATVVVEPISESAAPVLVAPSSTAAGATVRAYVANADPRFEYRWSVNGVADSAGLPAFSFPVGAAETQVVLSVATANLAGATTSPTTQVISVEPGQTLSLFSGQLSAEEGSNDGAVATARLRAAAALRKVGNKVLWLETPFVTPTPPSAEPAALTYTLRAIENGSTTTLRQFTLPVTSLDVPSTVIAQASLLADGSAFAVLGRKPDAQRLWYLGSDSSVSEITNLTLSTPSATALLTPTAPDITMLAGGSQSLFFAARDQVGLPTFSWLGRTGLTGNLTAELASQDVGTCQDGATPQILYVTALSTDSDESLWFIDNQRSV